MSAAEDQTVQNTEQNTQTQETLNCRGTRRGGEAGECCVDERETDEYREQMELGSSTSS